MKRNIWTVVGCDRDDLYPEIIKSFATPEQADKYASELKEQNKYMNTTISADCVEFND